MGWLPMFPLGSVLFPGVGLPLRIFEPRYRQLVLDALEHDGEFGVVLIERGSEVGGGDKRFSIGTVAKIVEAQPEDDGTWSVIAVGVRRIGVVGWLPDDPYPCADVNDVVDLDAIDADAVAQVISRLRRVLAMAAEAGTAAAPATVELADDPESALWQACALAPIGPLDELTLLKSPTSEKRIALLHTMLADEEVVLSHRLTGE
jgi:uncharacterized protein